MKNMLFAASTPGKGGTRPEAATLMRADGADLCWRRWMAKTLTIGAVAVFAFVAAAAEATLADFTKRHGWNPDHAVSDVAQTATGLTFRVSATDPWVLSPPMALPAVPDGTKRVRFSLACAPVPDKAEWQMFYSFGGRPYNEGDSCWLKPVGKPPYSRYEAEIPVGEVVPGPCSFRLDPPDGNRRWTVRSLSCAFRSPLWTFAPEQVPPLVVPASTPLVLRGEHWELRHDPDRLGAFRFLSRGKTVENRPEEPFVYLDKAGGIRTLDWSRAKMTVEQSGGRLTTSAKATDCDGNAWNLVRRFVPKGDALAVITEISCAPLSDANACSILHVPFLTLFVDRASQGRKRQALLAGVEYLADEPSSNEKEIRTHEHNRQIPAEYRLSAPLAVFTDDRHWLAAAWNQLAEGASAPPGPHAVAAVFDSPDRLFASGGHLLGFWAPAVGPARYESDRDIYAPTPFRSATQTVTLRTGDGATVAEALEGMLPPRPQTLPPPDEISETAALEALARGWLDSEIRNGTHVRHAVPFTWTRASDAPVLMRYLASELSRRPEADATLAPRLRTVADEMLAQIPRKAVGWGGVSHIHRPAPVLVAGDVTNWLARLDVRHRDLNRALASGKRLWTKPQQGRDFGETLGADHCNGFTAMELVNLLSAAVWSGDEAEIAKTLAIVDKVTALYRGTVPRGAQPWEMPLHTPDIVASGRLAHAYVLAYLLKPDSAYLREARYWGYTGLSMTYLVPPPIADARAVGRYATCGVMGATHWEQPNWIGRPVQWCGLVYADALWELACIETGDAAAFWRKLASGITASGVRQNHTGDEPDLIGLLPDSWDLTEQRRYAVPINPGTVQENLAECLGRPYYALRRLDDGSLLHFPGKADCVTLTGAADCQLQVRCEIEGWPEAPFAAVVTRTDKPRAVTLDGRPLECDYDAERRALVLRLPPRAAGELVLRR